MHSDELIGLKIKKYKCTNGYIISKEYEYVNIVNWEPGTGVTILNLSDGNCVLTSKYCPFELHGDYDKNYYYCMLDKVDFRKDKLKKIHLY